jgi:hypothetical protein
MSNKNPTKTQAAALDDHYFVTFLVKKQRNLNKKMREITDLLATKGPEGLDELQ